MKSKEPVRRKCVSCGEIRDKKDLIRIVRSKEGRVSLDIEGNKPGRGAYVCSTDCFERALKKNSLERSFRAKITEDDREGLRSGFPGYH